VLLLCASACSGGSGTYASGTTTTNGAATANRSDIGQVDGNVVMVSVMSSPEAHVEVRALNARHVVATAETNSRGRFTMKLRAGQYTFDVVTHVGCVFHPVLAPVTEGHRTAVELRCDVP